MGRLLVAALCSLALCGCPGPASKRPGGSGVTLTFLGWWAGEEQASMEKAIDQFTRQSGVFVKPMTVRESGAEGLARYVELLKNESSPADVYAIDVTWTGTLAEDLIDLNPSLGQEARSHFPGIVRNNTVDGRLVGMPLYTDVGLLFYRTDLLQRYGFASPPATWDELERMAARIQAGERARGRTHFWGFVWQGADYEGLTCNALEWQVSHGGGPIIEPDRRITVNNPRTLLALQRAARWVGSISPPGVVAYREEDARNLWQSGDAAFMRNWPYAYGMGQMAGSPVRRRFDVALLPSGGAQRASILGGWQLGVSRRSSHPREAVEFVRHMSSRGAQAQRAILISTLPTIPALWDDPQVLAANPYYSRLKEIAIEGVVERPSVVTRGSYYAVSGAYSDAVHSVLTGKVRAEQALSDLEGRLARITGFEPAAP